MVPRPDPASSSRSGPTWPRSGFDGMTRRRLAPGQAARLRRRPARLPLGRRPRPTVRAARAARPGCGRRSRPSTPAAAEFEADDAVPLLDLRGRGRGRARATGRKVLILGSGPTASARASSSTTAACTPASPCATPASRRSWSTATPRPCRPTTTRRDRLYFEPLTHEDVMNVIEAEQAAGDLVGVIVALGGQTPLKLADDRCPRASCSGTSRPSRSTWPRTASAGTPCAPSSRSPSPPAAPPPTVDEALAIVDRIGYPVLRAARATCSAAGPWRSSTTTTACARAMAELAGFGSPRPGGRPLGRAPGARRPLPRGRHRGRRRRHPRRHRRGRDRRGDGARRGGRGALGRLAPASSRRPLAVRRDDRR